MGNFALRPIYFFDHISLSSFLISFFPTFFLNLTEASFHAYVINVIYSYPTKTVPLIQ